jgi:hypothetical protein
MGRGEGEWRRAPPPAALELQLVLVAPPVRLQHELQRDVVACARAPPGLSRRTFRGHANCAAAVRGARFRKKYPKGYFNVHSLKEYQLLSYCRRWNNAAAGRVREGGDRGRRRCSAARAASPSAAASGRPPRAESTLLYTLSYNSPSKPPHHKRLLDVKKRKGEQPRWEGRLPRREHPGGLSRTIQPAA